MSIFVPIMPYSEEELAKIETPKILKAERDAVELMSEAKGLSHTLPNPLILLDLIVFQEASDSSKIENIVTTQDELYKAFSETIITPAVDPAIKEVMFYREALYEGLGRILKRDLISINDIVAIQKVLVQNDAGIRTLPGTKLVNDKTGEIVYTPPQNKDEIDKYLKNFTDYLNNGERSLVKLAMLHFQFESIHPFYDGNGRTGRILNILYLILKKYLDAPILYLSSFIIKNKNEYYEKLRDVHENENWEGWILYILNGIADVAKDVIKKIDKIKFLLDDAIEKTRRQLPKIYSKELVETIFLHPYCKVEFVVESVHVERKAASRYLYQLADIGLVEYEKCGRTNLFINRRLMALFG